LGVVMVIVMAVVVTFVQHGWGLRIAEGNSR
jgi:hypothetical protein